MSYLEHDQNFKSGVLKLQYYSPVFNFKKTEEKFSCKIKILLIVILLQSPSLRKCSWFCSDRLIAGGVGMCTFKCRNVKGTISKQFEIISSSFCCFYPLSNSTRRCNCTTGDRPSECDGLHPTSASKVWMWIQWYVVLTQFFICVFENECAYIHTHKFVCICTPVLIIVLI